MKKLYGLMGRSDEVVSIVYASWVHAFGTTDAASFMFMLSRWHGKGSRPDGFIYKTESDIEAETGIKRRRQKSIRTQLVKLGVLEVKKIPVNRHAILHYRLNTQTAQKLINISRDELDKIE